MRRLDPRDRPVLNAEALVAALAEHGVTWLLAGSYVLKLHGADLTPNDLDVVVARDAGNVERLACCLEALEAVPSWSSDPKWNLGTLDDHRAWTPWPATLPRLDQLFVTELGMLDIPVALVPPYEELLPGATEMEVGTHTITVCDPRRVLNALNNRNRKKDRERAQVYAEMRAKFGLSGE